ncbi:MAG: hypothetical protein FWC70_12170 [Defluviitaleaceae bacterium]|nr:hypothetical protein [Defluviitaleaceae bacterium]
MTERERNEKLFDAILKVAAEEALREEIDAMPSCEELNKMYPRSKSLDKKVYAAINRKFGAARRKRIARIFAKIAACFIFAAIGAGISGAFFLGVGSRAPEGEPQTGIAFGYIPQGFELVAAQEYYTFADDDGRRFAVRRASGDVIEAGSDYVRVEFRPQSIVPDIDISEITMEVGENIIISSFSLDSETLSKIAESIK